MGFCFLFKRGENMVKERRHICPRCGETDTIRIKRKKWMRHIPFTKLYDCQNCGCEYLIIFNFFKITTFCARD